MVHDGLVTVGSHRLRLTNLDKVLYPETGTTKAEVIEYYRSVSPALIRYAARRPATRKRWVDGVGTSTRPEKAFFQKNLDDSAPDWVPRGTIEHRTHSNDYPLIDDLPTLVWLAQMAALELHVPQWRFDAQGRPQNPDRLVLDLDPGEGVTLQECAEVAHDARAILEEMGLSPVPVTSGSKGIHLYAALDGRHGSDAVSAVAHELARALEADRPSLVTSDMKRSVRPGRVFVDWSQNNAAKSTIAPYSLRGRSTPTVAAPRTWKELASPQLTQLGFRDVLDRLKHGRDPFEVVAAGPSAAAVDGPGSSDPLATYRSMRDAARTPEPMGDTGSGIRGGGSSFVIQEHHARRLHYDFRLERDGVLVSWALPKGVPETSTRNHLAVRTEDHPLDYGAFEGEIPQGQYGAGTVVIWDRGEYELEKWRDGEIIVTLHGSSGGGLVKPVKIALIHTGDAGDPQKWLIHRMKESPLALRPVTGKAHTRARFIRPMLATLGKHSDLSDDEKWAVEMKWDGIRVIAVADEEGRSRLFSRNGRDVTATYPEIVAALRDDVEASSAVLDGEIVAMDGRGRPDFGLLQKRMGLTRTADVEQAARAVPVKYFVFDLLGQDGVELVDLAYAERRRRLALAVRDSPVIGVPPAFDGDVDEAMRLSRALGLEGVVAKQADGVYRPGLRSPGWIKLKHHRTQEVVVGGWRPGQGRRAHVIGSLLLGVPDEEGLRYVGRVGTGFTDNELKDVAKRIARRPRKTSPLRGVPPADARDAHWITPDLVGEVEFSEWTASGRLRQPSWRGWRPDKKVSDVAPEGA